MSYTRFQIPSGPVLIDNNGDHYHLRQRLRPGSGYFDSAQVQLASTSHEDGMVIDVVPCWESREYEPADAADAPPDTKHYRSTLVFKCKRTGRVYTAEERRPLRVFRAEPFFDRYTSEDFRNRQDEPAHPLWDDWALYLSSKYFPWGTQDHEVRTTHHYLTQTLGASRFWYSIPKSAGLRTSDGRQLPDDWHYLLTIAQQVLEMHSRQAQTELWAKVYMTASFVLDEVYWDLPGNPEKEKGDSDEDC